ncbi:MAG: hypothetical protein KKA42_12700 [candidate division Zixibacteria bacterium]|nr:hypothetical protein [candidate division Zixibacteria bacterium]
MKQAICIAAVSMFVLVAAGGQSPVLAATCDTAFYYDDTAPTFQPWLLPNEGVIEQLAVRFSVTPEATAYPLNLGVFLDGSRLRGTPGLRVYISDMLPVFEPPHDGWPFFEVPFTDIDAALMGAPNWLNIVPAAYGMAPEIMPGHTYYAVFEAVGLDGDTLCFLSDFATGPFSGEPEGRSWVRTGVGWQRMQDVSGGDFIPVVRAEHCYLDRECGDIDAISGVGLSDLSAFNNLLYTQNIPIDPEWVADLDQIPGITNHDYQMLIDHLFISFGTLVCDLVPGATFPVSDEDTLVFLANEIPAGETATTVDVVLRTNRTFCGLAVPFSYAAVAPGLTLDSATFSTADGYPDAYIDNVSGMAVIALNSTQANIYPPGDFHVATLWLTVPPQPAVQTLTIDTTDALGYHRTVLSRYGAPDGMIPHVVVRQQTSGCFATGDVNDDGALTILDVTALVNFLYIDPSSPPPAPLYEADLTGDCVVDSLDAAALVCVIFNPPYSNCIAEYPMPTCCDPRAWTPADTVMGLGDALVTFPEKGAIRVDGIGTTGRDGARMYMDDITSEGVSMVLENIDMSVANAAVSFTLHGFVEDPRAKAASSLQMLCGVGVANSVGSSVQFMADFRPIGDTTVTWQIFNSGHRVAQDIIYDYGLIAIGNDAGYGLPIVTSISMFGTAPPGFAVTLDRETEFSIVGYPTMYGDEIRFISVNSKVSVGDLYACDVQGTFLGWFAMSGFKSDVCCRGFSGNVDNDAYDFVDIGDLTALIDYLFINFTDPACEPEAEVNAEGIVDIGDLSRLIDFLFISFDPTEPCSP